MKELAHLVFSLVRLFGGFSLLIVGILDSSFLFMPLGNDLLVIALTAQKRSIPLMLYYAGMSTAGSVLGCLLVDLVFRKAGEEGLDKHLPKARLDYVKNKVRKGAAWALAVASIAPPPFPFTPVIMVASALEYPRKKLLTVVGAVRMVRFTGLGVLALFFGRRILSWGEQPAVEWFILGLVALFVIGSAFSVVRWIRHSRQPRHPVAEHR
jgi:membrane protein YqaA with SNARE-associated domain